MMKHLILLCSAFLAGSSFEGHDYWKGLGESDLKSALNQKKNSEPAKNVILFVADGMGPTTVTASRIYAKSEKGSLSFENFPNIGVLKTYSADKLVPDSCSTATALFCGIKANQKTSGVDATVAQGDCPASLVPDARLPSIISWAQEAGKKTGFVTTTRVTHATPSALFSHSADRNWECEATMPGTAADCKDIARQLVEDEPGRSINVIMGGGKQCLVSGVVGSESDPIDTYSCYSNDSRNLIMDWENDKAARSLKYAVLTNNEDLEKVDVGADHVLGIFANGHLKMEHNRDKSPQGMPSLTNMTLKAIQILNANPNGFLLVVEGGLIDQAHHRGHAKQALDETVSFQDVIEKTLEVLADSLEETLIIVTSDHSHSLVFTGYADRGSSMLGIGEKSKIDYLPYTSLLYGTGGPDNFQFSSINDSVVRKNPAEDNLEDFGYAQQAVVLTDEVTHAGTDVLVYAQGPMSHLFHSIHEQTYVAYVISYAARIGPFREADFGKGATASSQTVLVIFLVLTIIKTA